MTEKYILVSGGAGYIGSHTALALQKSGYIPVVIDNLSTSDGSFADKFGPFRQGDVGDQAFVKRVCNEFRPQALIHFAAFSLVGESIQQPEKYFTNNVEKAGVLFDTAHDHGVKHVVFSSTAAVYGAVQGNKPIIESQPLKPINPYGESKLRAETYLRNVQGVTSVVLRYFNAAGAADETYAIGEAHWPESHLIPNVILATLRPEQKLSIFGTDYPTLDGTCIRDYIHVTDLATAHVQALEYLFKGGLSEVCNLGTGTGNSVMDIIQTAEREIGMPVKYDIGARREGDPAILVADNSKAKQLLGWQPRRNLTAILNSAIAWHRTPYYQQFLQAKLA